MTPNTPQNDIPTSAGPAGLIRHLDQLFFTLILAVLAIHFWAEAPRREHRLPAIPGGGDVVAIDVDDQLTDPALSVR